MEVPLFVAPFHDVPLLYGQPSLAARHMPDKRETTERTHTHV